MLKNSSSSSKNPNPTIPTPTLSNKFKRRIKPIIQKAHLKLKPSSQITLTFWAKCNFFYLFSVEYSTNQGPFDFWHALIDHQQNRPYSHEEESTPRKSSFEDCQESEQEI
jgi:hypothetical protein